MLLLRSRRIMDCFGCRTLATAAAPTSALAAAPRAAPPEYELVGPLEQLPLRGLKQHVLLNGTPLCIVSRANRSELQAIGDECPHKSASLSKGDIEDALGPLSVKCPKHRKKFGGGVNFRVENGSGWVAHPERCTHKFNPDWSVPVYDISVRDGNVFVATTPREGTRRTSRGSAGDDVDEVLVEPGVPTSSFESSAAAAAPSGPGGALIAAAPLCHGIDAGFEQAVRVSDLPSGLTSYTLRSGPYAGVRLCLISHQGSLQAIYDTCPHKQAQLSLGDIEDSDASKGVCVRCPRHRRKFPGGLKFCASNGTAWVTDPAVCETPFDPAWAVPVFRVRIDEHGWGWISQEPIAGIVPPDARETQAAIAAESAAESAAAASAPTENGSAAKVKKPKKLAQSAIVDSAPSLSLFGSDSHTVVHTVQRAEHASITSTPPVPSAAPMWTPAVLQAVKPVSHDSLLFRFVSSVPAPVSAANVDAYSWHVSVQIPAAPAADAAATAASRVERDYTPVSPLHMWSGQAATAAAAAILPESAWWGDDAPAATSGYYIDLLVKVYPRGGFTSRLAKLTLGARLLISAPRSTLCTPFLLPPVFVVPGGASTAAVGGDAAVAVAVSTVTLESEGDATHTHLKEVTLPAGASAQLIAAEERESIGSTHHSYYADGDAVGMIAGGTGITPLLQLAVWALSSASTRGDVPRSVYLLVSNHTDADVLGKDAIRRLALSAPDRLRVLHTYTSAATGPTQSASMNGALIMEPDADLPNVHYTRGRVSASMLRAFFPAPLATTGSSSAPTSSSSSAPQLQLGEGAAVRLKRVVVSGPARMWETVKTSMEEAGHGDCLVELEA